MTFYGNINFFLILIALIIPAAILRYNNKNIVAYGLAVSVLMMGLLFYKSLTEAMYFLFFILIETLLAFYYLKSRSKGKNKRVYLVILFCALAPLAAFKIGMVFNKNILGFLGISYITFKAVQIIIEIYDGLIKKLTLTDYLYFLLFFPTFTSGPIDRSRRFEADNKKVFEKKEYIDMLSTGLKYLLTGAFYKYVISIFFMNWYITLKLFSITITVPLLVAHLFNIYTYGFYLFFDFAGYSLMAVGASYCFGIKTPLNFDKPFISTDIKDFWNRWHISLSTWLRDFLFMRYVMLISKHKWIKDKLTIACSGYLINMIVMGLWHGITPAYIIYGCYHGILLALTDWYQKKSKFYAKYKNHKIYRFFSWFITFQLVMLGFGIFSGKINIQWMLSLLK